MYIEKKYGKLYKKEDFCLYSTRPCREEFWQKPRLSPDYAEIKHKEKLLFQQFELQPVEEKIRVEIDSRKVIELPIRLSKLARSIEESMYILELEEDFDGEESVGYQFSTWERAIDFLVNYSKWALEAYKIIIDSPKIYQGPDGSIDILWKTQGYKLLINIPEKLDCPASFYGDDFKMDKIKGTFDPLKLNRGLLMLLLDAK